MDVFAAWRLVLLKSIAAAEVQVEIRWRVRSMPQGCCWWEMFRRLWTRLRVIISRPLRIIM